MLCFCMQKCRNTYYSMARSVLYRVIWQGKRGYILVYKAMTRPGPCSELSSERLHLQTFNDGQRTSSVCSSHQFIPLSTQQFTGRNNSGDWIPEAGYGDFATTNLFNIHLSFLPCDRHQPMLHSLSCDTAMGFYS